MSDADWGGLFLYKDSADAIHGIVPSFNCGLRNAAHIRHATTIIAPDAAEPRFTLQLFLK